MFSKFFKFWFAMTFIIGLATLGAFGYAVYWGLSVTEDFVHQEE